MLFGSSQEGTSKNKRKEKPGCFFFRKKEFSSFVRSRNGTYYALFLGCFDLKSLLDIFYCVSFVVVEILASNSFHNNCNKFFIHHCQGWEEGSLMSETVWFLFSNWILILLSWVFFAFCPKFCWDSYLEFQREIISEIFSEISCTPRLYPLSWFVKFCPTFCNFIISAYYAETFR